MPRKIRQLESDLLRSGFLRLHDRGKGDHRMFVHPDHPEITITLDGKSGDDAKPYQEKDVREAMSSARRHEEGR